ncbi:MAG TPA: trypsin-like serine protease [Polyangiaceae bacterium]|jgi:hypothetical protein
MRLVVLLLVSTLLFAVHAVACSSTPSNPLATAPPSVAVASPFLGIRDPGADPAVVLLDLDGQGVCAGALLASDVVLTARRCVSILSGPYDCPAGGPQVADGVDLTNIRVLTGDLASTAVERARGRAVLLPQGDVLCGADVALLLLDSPIDDVAPLVVRPTGAAVGDHVRTVGFASGAKVVRDHVAVSAVTPVEIAVAEAPCDGAFGGPAIDEGTGQIVGVLARGGPSCGASDAYDVDTRTDAYADLVAEALAEGTQSHEAYQAKEKKSPVDVGADCSAGSDCAAGACVSYAGSQYCTRGCDAHDTCPTHYRCMGGDEGRFACVLE